MQVPSSEKDKMSVKNLTTLEEIAPVLEKYNFFHDAFIKAVSVVSKDRFFKDEQGDIVKEVSESMTVKLSLAHYNYKPLPKSLEQVVTLSFGSVKNLSIDTEIENDPMGLDVTEASLSEATKGLLQLTLKGGSRKQSNEMYKSIFSIKFANLQFSVEKENAIQ